MLPNLLLLAGGAWIFSSRTRAALIGGGALIVAALVMKFYGASFIDWIAARRTG